MAGRINSRKGFFFTLLVVLLFFLVLLSLRSWITSQQTPESLAAVRDRADAMSGMVGSAVADADRMTYLAGNRSVYYAAFYVGYNRTPLNNSNSSIYEIMWNASLNGSPSYGVPTGTCSFGSALCFFANQTENATMNPWWSGFAGAAGRYGVSPGWSTIGFSASQSSATAVSISHNTSFELNDSAGVASFSRTASFNRSINLTGFEDPMHSLFMNGTAHRKIAWWPYSYGYQLVTTVSTGSSGANGWAYGTAITLSGCCVNANCSDGTIPAGDKGKLLVVNDASAVAAGCASVANAYGGVLSTNGNGSMPNITVPYVYGFGSSIPALVPNGTAVLVNNDGSRHEVLNVSRLRSFIASPGYYRPNRKAPDFLTRLQNSTGQSTYGIESLVNSSEAATAAVSNRSWVDYYFLAGTNCSTITCYKIKGTANCENATLCADETLTHFRLDNGTVSLSGVQDCYTPPSGMVGWWPGDGDLSDIVAGHTGTAANTTYDAGKVMLGFNFSGTNSYVDLDNVVVDTTAGAKNTVEFWMYKRGGGGMPIGWSNGYDLYNASGCLGFNTGQSNVLGENSTNIYNAWHHIAAVFYNGVPNATNSELWIDGVKQTLAECTVNPTTLSKSATSSARISGWRSGTGYYINGIIDDFAIYNRSLTQPEIQGIYNAGLSGKCHTSTLGHLNYYGVENVTVSN